MLSWLHAQSCHHAIEIAAPTSAGTATHAIARILSPTMTGAFTRKVSPARKLCGGHYVNQMLKRLSTWILIVVSRLVLKPTGSG